MNLNVLNTSICWNVQFFVAIESLELYRNDHGWNIASWLKLGSVGYLINKVLWKSADKLDVKVYTYDRLDSLQCQEWCSFAQFLHHISLVSLELLELEGSARLWVVGVSFVCWTSSCILNESIMRRKNVGISQWCLLKGWDEKSTSISSFNDNSCFKQFNIYSMFLLNLRLNKLRMHQTNNKKHRSH